MFIWHEKQLLKILYPSLRHIWGSRVISRVTVTKCPVKHVLLWENCILRVHIFQSCEHVSRAMCRCTRTCSLQLWERRKILPSPPPLFSSLWIMYFIYHTSMFKAISRTHILWVLFSLLFRLFFSFYTLFSHLHWPPVSCLSMLRNNAQTSVSVERFIHLK